MNERIRELAEQCWEESQSQPAWFNQEKFAQLIVLECCGILEYNHHDTISRQSASDFLKKHFGVE